MKNFILIILFAQSFLFAEVSYNKPLSKDTNNISANIPTREFKLKSGKSFIVMQEPESEYLYDVRVIGVGFQDSKDTILFDEVEHVDTILVADINNDGFEEIYIFTKGFAPGDYDHVFGITSDEDKTYKEINFPRLKPDEIKEGGIFEGYNGRDVYRINNNVLERTFPIHKPGDTYQNPEGGYRTIYYSLEKTVEGFFYKIKGYE